ncbi:MAG: iron-containing alcohol dehydrogenase [Bacteroidota bacterium]
MQKFVIYQPTRILFGAEMKGEFVKACLPFGKKGMIVTGGSSMERLGYLDEVKAAFAEQGIELIHFKGIEPNPVAQTINKAAKIGQEAAVDFILALGGGSVMDASKAIGGLIHAQEDDVWPYVLGEPKSRQMKGAIPILTIPTTAATASEVTAYAVISNPEVNGKSVLGYEFFKPLVSWMNPAYTTSLGARTTQDGAADILSHVLENYILGGDNSPIADRYTEMVIHTVLETLPKVLKDPENLDLRADLLWASDLALNGYQLAGRNPSQFVLHSMEHAASGFHPELAHGRGLATLYPAYFHWLWEQDRARERFAQLGRRIFD